MRPSRANAAPLFDRGTDHAQAMQALYGQDGTDSIGRLFRAGCLGEGSEAKALLDLSRGISAAYWRAYANGSYTCALGDRTFGSVVELDAERAKRREQWLSDCLDTVRGMGPQTDRAFRQLCIDVNPDCGPSWVDRLCWARRVRADPLPDDARRLEMALGALRTLGA